MLARPQLIGRPLTLADFVRLQGRAPLTYYQRIRSFNPTAYWPLNEASGPLALDHSRSDRINVDEFTIYNGDFETAGSGGADIWAGWSEYATDGALADETSVVHGGGHAAKVTSGDNCNTWIVAYCTIHVEPGQECTLKLWVRGDGSESGRYAIYDCQNAAWIASLTSLAVTATEYTEKTIQFTPPAGCVHIRLYLAGPNRPGCYCYFDDVTLTYDQSFAGVYAPSGVTLGVDGVLPGETAVQVDGNNTYVWVGWQALNSVWNGDKGSAIAWGKVDGSARWTDASTYRYLWHPKSRYDQTVYMVMGKSTTNHQLEWRRRVASGIFSQTYTFDPAGPTTWFCMGMAWDRSVPFAACYLYAPAVLPFTTIYSGAPELGMEEWGDNPVDDFNHMLLAGSNSNQEWIGCGAHIAYWAGRVLSAAEMRRVMVP
jgi:hypothetical protein